MPDRATEVAWAAGLFEGEGYFTLSTDDKPRPRAGLNTTDRDVIDRFLRVVGVGAVYDGAIDRRWVSQKRLFMWSVNSVGGFLEVVNLLGPYLGERRTERLLEMLDRVSPVTASSNSHNWARLA